MNLNDHLYMWNHAFIQVMDIRHVTMKHGEELQAYLLPASAFLYTVRGNAKVCLNHKLYEVKRFHLFHGGKGMWLHIEAVEELAYYLILYKATLSLPYRQDKVRLLEEENPFQSQYAFRPHYPLTLFDKVERLDLEWKEASAWGKMQVRSIFYQFVCELLWQLEQQGIRPIKADLAAMATDYIHEHFREPLTLDSIAEVLECSAGHLSRLFKSKMNKSPIYYLGEIRVDRTAQLLATTDATLQEIAERVGFSDAHSLSRTFKKYKGISPARFRRVQAHLQEDQELPHSMREIAVFKSNSNRYTDIENHYQYRVRGELFMFNKNKVAIMTVFMCLSLMLSACSSLAQTNTSVNNQASDQQTTEGQQTAAEVKTRTVSTPRGDVEVPLEPKRVAADQYMGYLLKLGIIPVGVRTLMLNESWIKQSGIPEETLKGIADLGDNFPMNLEKLVDLEPDLIIGSVAEHIEQYEKIGTTVLLPYWVEKSTAGPLDKFRSISEIFGKQEEAEKWIAAYQQKVEKARDQIKGVIKEGETVSVVQIAEKSVYVLAAKGGNYGSTTIYEMLQLPPTQSALDMKEGFASISMESLPDYLGDHVFVYNSSPEATDGFLKSALWKATTAAKKDQVYIYGNMFNDEFVMEDPYSLELQLSTIVDLLLSKQKK
ncbi:AraC family transcriptional regulator [Paenibacillus selenitireducens]|uniref:AraC family transcriptional regulator n=1 Tax=Paenibacillus selenitireducens TaxID=1324314 RepID=A0A1T2XM92_9BACL|nr:ABC transporter substrate-binding protein [Paenibacillus selenitireducens]OPA81000.1 AraC family transcriptional regulator [Paenibacillus selenitireducens]